MNQIGHRQVCFSHSLSFLTLDLDRVVVRRVHVDQAVRRGQRLPLTFPANSHAVHRVLHGAVHAKHVGIVRRRDEIHVHVLRYEAHVQVQKGVVFHIRNTNWQQAFGRAVRHRARDHRLDQDLVYPLVFRNTITDWLEGELLVLETDRDGVVDSDSRVSTFNSSCIGYTVSGLFMLMSKSRN